MTLITAFGDFGTNDFIEYWTAFRLFISQSNPYDPTLMKQLQGPLVGSESTPLMMWNPPWLLLIMAPVLMLDFPQAATAWLLVNLALLGAIVYLCLDLIGFASLSRTQKYLSIPLTLTFFPLYTSLAIGQLGVLLAFAFIGAIWSIIRRNLPFGSLCLALWTLKAHLFMPMAVFLIFKACRNRELWSFFIWASLALGTLVTATEILHPGATNQWFSAFSLTKDHHDVILVDQWVSATLTGGIRRLFADGDQIPVFPMIVVPGLAMTAIALLTIQLGSRLPYLEGALLCALSSMTFGPFGWIFDCTILLPGYLICCLKPFRPAEHLVVMQKIAQVIPFVLIQLGGWCCLPYFVYIHWYMWFAPAMFVATIFCGSGSALRLTKSSVTGNTLAK